MSYELTGKLTAKMEVMQRSETFKTREFVIEKSEDINGRTITNFIKFQCVQDKTALPDRFNLGDEVKVFFNIILTIVVHFEINFVVIFVYQTKRSICFACICDFFCIIVIKI